MDSATADGPSTPASSSLPSDDLPVILDGTFFSIISKDGTKIIAKCNNCPQSKEFSGAINATSNFLKHLRNAHKELIDDYENRKSEEASRRRKRKPMDVVANSQGQLIAKQPKITNFGSVRHVPKAANKYDKLIVRFVIKGLHPLTTIEEPDFIELLKSWNPEPEIMSRRTLGRRIEELNENMVQSMRKLFSTLKYVCVTADIWTCGGKGRSFLGITIHWITSNLQRESAALACMRFKGKHSYDKIIELWTEVMGTYNLPVQKIVKVVTDNGSNFVKAFEKLETEVGETDLVAGGRPSENDNGDESNDEIDFEDFTSLLDMAQNTHLPPHQRCASHTLNLICATDTTGSFSNFQKSAFAKCYGIWNKIGRSTQQAEKVKAICGKQLLKPCVTRWNSLYDSIRSVLEQKQNIKAITEAMELPLIKESEIDALEEYIKCVKPIAEALDRLQGEHSCFFGELIPTILTIRKKLSALKSEKLEHSLKLISGLETRFKDFIALSPIHNDAIMGAVSHPYFKMRWVPADKTDIIRQLFIDETCKILSAEEVSVQKSQQSSLDCIEKKTKDDRFFSFDDSDPTNQDQESLTNKIRLECLHYLDDIDSEIFILQKYPAVREMFKKYNTAVPSSAPVERLFNYSGMILSPKRRRIGDELFQKLTVMKANKQW